MSIRLGATIAAIVVAALALEDITTDTAGSFVPEWTALAVCAAWLTVDARRLWRRRRASRAPA